MRTLLPGIIFTTATIVTFVLQDITIKPKELFVYIVVMELIYLIFFYLTLFSLGLFFIIGILAGGAGANAVFYIINWTIFPIVYSERRVFLLGGLSFLIYDILIVAGVGNITGRFIGLNNYIDSALTIVFVTWQIIIGMEIFYQTKKTLIKKYGS